MTGEMRRAIGLLVVILLFGASVRMALVRVGDGARRDAFCIVDSDFWTGDHILC